MALTFPSNPTNGATSGDYTYDSTKTAWRKNGVYPVSVTHSDVAPSNPRAGDQWWKSNEGTLFTYYYDGDSYQWVESTNVVANVEPNPIPAGAMMAWGSDTIPANWLLCDGSAISRSTYASLFAAIGTQYGSGDGSTTFNLPNLKGKTIVGKDSTQTEFDVLGETGGAKTHTLTSAEMPSHQHNNLIWNPGYTSGIYNSYRMSAVDNVYTNGAVTGQTSATGGGGAHNNLQPYIVLNYIIKFSAGETPGDSQLAVRVGTLETQNNATPLSQNYLINGAYDFWQRGTSFSTSAAYTADRWVAVAASGQTLSVSQQAFTPGAAPVAGYEGTYYTRVAWSGTPSGYFWYNQKVEDVRTLAGQTVTLSFWAKASTATSALNSTIELNMGSGGAGGTTLNGSALSLTTSWTRYATTFTLPSMSGKTIGTSSYLDVRLLQGASTVNGINIDIWGAQLEAGPYATPFRRNAPSIQAELAACQRYYQAITAAGAAFRFFGSGSMYQPTLGGATINLPVVMRKIPTVTTSAASNFQILTSSANIQLSGIAGATGNQSADTIFLDITIGTSISAGAGLTFRANNSTSAAIYCDAEL